jgi:hypothetical protein
MPESRLLWFLSTEWMGVQVEGQTFLPDDEGYIAVPENLGTQIKHPSFRYVGRERPNKIAAKPNTPVASAAPISDVPTSGGNSAALLARRTNETTQLPASEMPSADRPPSETEASGKPATPTASYFEVKSAVEKHGRDTERGFLMVVKEALPNKHVPREWVRQARDELFGKPGRSGRPKSPRKSR